MTVHPTTPPTHLPVWTEACRALSSIFRLGFPFLGVRRTGRRGPYRGLLSLSCSQMSGAPVVSGYTDASRLDTASPAGRVYLAQRRYAQVQLASSVCCCSLFFFLVVVFVFVPSFVVLMLAVACLVCFTILVIHLACRGVQERRRRRQQRRGRTGDAADDSSEVEVDGFVYNQQDGTFAPILAVPENSLQRHNHPADAANTLQGVPILQSPSSQQGYHNTATTQAGAEPRKDADAVYGRASYTQAPLEVSPANHPTHAVHHTAVAGRESGERLDAVSGHGHAKIGKPDRRRRAEKSPFTLDDDAEELSSQLQAAPLLGMSRAAQATPSSSQQHAGEEVTSSNPHQQQGASGIDLWSGVTPATADVPPPPQVLSAESTTARDGKENT